MPGYVDQNIARLCGPKTLPGYVDQNIARLCRPKHCQVMWTKILSGYVDRTFSEARCQGFSPGTQVSSPPSLV